MRTSKMENRKMKFKTGCLVTLAIAIRSAIQTATSTSMLVKTSWLSWNMTGLRAPKALREPLCRVKLLETLLSTIDQMQMWRRNNSAWKSWKAELNLLKMAPRATQWAWCSIHHLNPSIRIHTVEARKLKALHPTWWACSHMTIQSKLMEAKITSAKLKRM